MDRIVIFDMDGVLLNSERLYMEMNQAFFRQLGAVVSPDEHKSFVGISATVMWSRIKEKNNLLQTVPELIAAEKDLKYKMLSETDLQPSNGVKAFLEYLKVNNIPVSLASSSMSRNIHLILDKLLIREYFDFIISGEQVKKGKPEPDIFLEVSNYYNIAPEKCIVIEDSTNGVKAAKAANMLCIGYYNPDSGDQDLSLADYVIDSFTDVKLYDIVGRPVA